MEIDIKEIRELMRAVQEYDISELELEQEGQRIFLRRGTEPTLVQAAPALSIAASAPPAATHPAPPATSEVAAPEGDFITSPFVGTFYRAPSPEAAPFVSAGDRVSIGAPLCIVEAMKLMNEIEAEVDCEILEIMATNGKPVEYGERLFRIRKA